jgi:hypothetical protein
MSFFRQSWVRVNDAGDMVELDTHIDHFSGEDPIKLDRPEEIKAFNENVLLLLKKLKELYFGGK